MRVQKNWQTEGAMGQNNGTPDGRPGHGARQQKARKNQCLANAFGVSSIWKTELVDSRNELKGIMVP